MNIQIAKQRYKNVFRPDVMNNTQGDIFGYACTYENLYVTSHADVTPQDKNTR